MGGAIHDVVVVGGGHNGLVCAAYLARAGRKVVVLERRATVGGAAATEEVWPGYRVSTASYVVSLLPDRIVRDLDLHRFGYHVFPLDPAYYAPLPDDPGVLVWDDPRRAADEIRRLSAADGDAFLAYSSDLDALAAVIRPLLFRIPPAPGLKGPRDWGRALLVARDLLRHRTRLPDLVDLMTMSCADFLGRYFSDERVLGILAPGGVIGAWGGPMSPGSAYVLLHHRMGEVAGVRSAWGFVRGGMGALSEAIAGAARAAGAEIRTDAEVRRIVVEGGAARAVVLADGTEVRAHRVVSGLHPRTTLLDLVGRADLPEEVVVDLDRYRSRSASAKVHFAIDRLPSFAGRPGRDAGPQHPEFIISPSLSYLERAWDDAKYGRMSERPLMDCVIPTTMDDTLAPPGAHVVSCFVQYAPYDLAQGRGSGGREELIARAARTIEDHAPGFTDSIRETHALTPEDLEARFGLVGGNIFHGEMSLDQLFSFRPSPSMSGHRTPIAGLYLCGSGTHPGGGVMGIPGYNAARVVARRR